MKFLSVLAVAIAITSANAALLVARVISPDGQYCLDSLTDVEYQSSLVAYSASYWTVASGYIVALGIEAYEIMLETYLATAENLCCSNSDATTYEDQEAILSNMSTLLSHVTDLLGAFIGHKYDFDSVPLVTQLIISDIVNLRRLIKHVTSCLVSKISAAYYAEASNYEWKIIEAFNNAFDEFDIM